MIQSRTESGDRVLRGIFLTILSTFFTAAGQFCFKLSAGKILLTEPLTLLFSLTVWLGVFLYVITLLLMLQAYRYADLTLLFPLTSLCFVWNILFAVSFLGEVFTPGRLVGTALIIIGATVINKRS